ncbi:MAG: PIN domain nuclease [Acidimicrobiia bacterium]|nr:PIN domain nuclease [Acidimicrobiia bacterium]
MTLIDTSAWIEFLKATGSDSHRAVRSMLDTRAELHTTDIVIAELLAGARDDQHLERLRGLLGRCSHLPIEGLTDYEAAADIYRTCRRAGETVRALTDCVIAAVALRTNHAVLHADRDFDLIARHTGLAIYRVG